MNRLHVARCIAPLLALTLAACATSGPTASLDQRIAARHVVLLGEVHDNAEGHRIRFDMLKRRVDAGWRPVIAMEQFDLDRQAALDDALRTCADAACVIHAASPANAGWQWRFYEPVIDLALQQHLRIVAANVSRADAARVMREGFGAVLDADTIRAAGLDQPLPADIDRAQTRAVDDGHCGLLPPAMLPLMVRAQVARDAGMARAVQAHAKEGVVLLAGNGHVRRDIGVARWFSSVAPNDLIAVGFVEGGAPEGQFDAVVTLAPIDRGDPCEGVMRPPSR
ncbi:ChaN family lipoprotein [Uliginosibacterium sp. sgz301328]|uniref:ChaN family lipoprotein n=1 Tax=Uliginosibacterium sp. sgz301328 TaxID=3243764 RepID=UPI00359E592A